MNRWTKGEVIAVFSLFVAVLGVAANNPELRCSLFKDCSAPPSPEPTSSPVPDFSAAIPSEPTLISPVTGVDYSPLRDLLAAEQWKEADELTWKLMLKAAKREQLELGLDYLENIPCSDLKTIDQLWVKYSQGKFGFSIQKQLYLSLGGKLDEENLTDDDNWTDQDYYNYHRFAIMVGWKTGTPKTYEGYKKYNELTFNLFAPNGHLPRWGAGERGAGLLFSHAQTCNL